LLPRNVFSRLKMANKCVCSGAPPQTPPRELVPHISLIAAFFRIFQQSARIAYFFPHKFAFSTTILVLFVFLLPISIRFRYLDIWLPTVWQHPCVRPCGTRSDSQFQATLYHITAYFCHIFGAYAVRIYCFYMLHKTDMPN